MQDLSCAEQKTSLRNHYRTLRQQLSATQKQTATSAINAQLTSLPLPGDAVVCGYLAQDGEADIQAALETLRKQGKVIYLPVISSSQPGQMQFRQWQENAPLTANRFGIPEPQSGVPLNTDQQLIILIPLVAYTRHGQRLGMGGGYYDRYLAGLLKPARTQRAPFYCRTIGIAFSQQQADQLPHADWDQPLDEVLNEHEWINCNKETAKCDTG